MARGGYFSVDSLKGVHVLVADDDAIAREVVTAILNYCGALVLTVRSSRETLDMMRLIKPDVLVVKLDLPDRNGVALVRDVRRLKPEAGGEVPVIAVAMDDRARDECVANGFQAHFTWPLNPWEFTRTIASLTVAR